MSCGGENDTCFRCLSFAECDWSSALRTEFEESKIVTKARHKYTAVVDHIVLNNDAHTIAKCWFKKKKNRETKQKRLHERRNTHFVDNETVIILEHDTETQNAKYTIF